MFSLLVKEPVPKEWAAYILLTFMKDGLLQLSVHTPILNALAIRDQYQIPCNDECIDTLGIATVFYTEHTNRGYWTIEVDKVGRYKSALISHHRQYRFECMQFVLNIAPKAFRREAVIITMPVISQFVALCNGDIVAFPRSPSEHTSKVRPKFSLSRSAGVTLKLKKWTMLIISIDSFGHVIRLWKLLVTPHDWSNRRIKIISSHDRCNRKIEIADKNLQTKLLSGSL